MEAAEGAEGSAVGGEVKGAVERALEALERARRVLVPKELEGDPAFVAQLVQMLLLTEDGVAEAFEEFMEGSPGGYLEGWAVLQRVKRWWARLGPAWEGSQASVEESVKDLEEPLQEMDGLFRSPVPPSNLVEDPEVAEEVADRVVAALEELTGVSLYPERDLSRAAGLTRALAGAGCEEHRSGNAPLAREHLFASQFVYEQYLADSLQVLEPDLHERTAARLAGLTDDGASAEACDELLSDTHSPACSHPRMGRPSSGYRASLDSRRFGGTPDDGCHRMSRARAPIRPTGGGGRGQLHRRGGASPSWGSTGPAGAPRCTC